MFKLIIGIIYIITIILYCAILVKKKIKDTSTYYKPWNINSCFHISCIQRISFLNI